MLLFGVGEGFGALAQELLEDSRHRGVRAGHPEIETIHILREFTHKKATERVSVW
jgi:hypothetical protein